MSNVIQELSTIEVGDDVIRELDLGGIFESFSENYKKLDNLKNFRTAHEKRNALMRFVKRGQLADAHLDSAELQAEFSKTIGQLMMISIMQSKKLTEQQALQREQQMALGRQADGIASQAAALQQQHHLLAIQSKKLNDLVSEFLDLKGFTEEGIEKFIKISGEVKATRDSLRDEFGARDRQLYAALGQVKSEIDALKSEVTDQISGYSEKMRVLAQADRLEMQKRVDANETTQRTEVEALRNLCDRHVESTGQRVSQLSHTCDTLITSLTQASRDADQKLTSHIDNFNAESARVQLETSQKLRGMRQLLMGMSLAMAGLFVGLGYLIAGR
jgi:hypothetical protein